MNTPEYKIISIFEYNGFYTYHISKNGELDQVVEFDSEANVTKTSFKQNSEEEQEAVEFIRRIRNKHICSVI
ncbi:hypothetical protein CHI96_16785 [Proteus mirabilis]|jgi:hypothetical protein|uniref:Uncharacterized protein n=2 Tax=Morganellaceae TaxID=1903414 RepID=A0A218N4B6_PROMI|nr:hypothetical protein PRE36P2_0490 [Providencia rettgeri]ASB04161.1 hypothetical protein AM403_21100 [Proteus mirabilis]ASF81040.1 hypothetical protein PM64421b_00044 [Proteus mirabilis]AUU37423.1 hypothetical protein MC72_018875 [Proteus mirabilis]OZS65044.1 hypothetical protein CHI96_16785 [Proteus mirabilis]